jgi:TatD DNase family protein
MYIDSHAHITSDALFPDVEGCLARARDYRVEAIVNICTNAITLERGIALAKRYPWVHNAAATTPHDVEKEGEQLFPLMEKAAREGALVAVGETGLDYHYTHSPRELQQEFLRRYLRLALSCRLPVVIHCREAFSDFFKILDQEYMIEGKHARCHAPGVLHCFTGTVAEAQQVVERGWFLSLSGIVTFKKSVELKEVAKSVPLEQLLIETDSPYLAPQSKRGKTNEPAYLPEIAAHIAELKGMSTEAVAMQTTLNAKRLFRF